MEMPINYKETMAAGEFTPIELGGHYLVIKQVEETTNKNGRAMIKVSFDTASNDKQPNYFADVFRNDIRPDKKWPANGATYINVNDQNGKCSRSFKGFTTSVEKSNPGFSIQWGPGFAACFKEKLVGGIFGEELGFYNGKETRQHKLRWFCANEKVPEASIPNPTETKEYKAWMESGGITTSPADKEGFMNIPEGALEELPFN